MLLGWGSIVVAWLFVEEGVNGRFFVNVYLLSLLVVTVFVGRRFCYVYFYLFVVGSD